MYFQGTVRFRDRSRVRVRFRVRVRDSTVHSVSVVVVVTECQERTTSVSAKNWSRSRNVHSDEMGGLGKKAAYDEYHHSLMVEND